MTILAGDNEELENFFLPKNLLLDSNIWDSRPKDNFAPWRSTCKSQANFLLKTHNNIEIAVDDAQTVSQLIIVPMCKRFNQLLVKWSSGQSNGASGSDVPLIELMGLGDALFQTVCTYFVVFDKQHDVEQMRYYNIYVDYLLQKVLQIDPINVNLLANMFEAFEHARMHVDRRKGPVTLVQSNDDADVSDNSVGARWNSITNPKAINDCKSAPKKDYLFNILYKTEKCKHFMQSNGYCPMGSKCHFAHGADELRNPRTHPKFRSQICHHFWNSGTCLFKSKCFFRHIAPPDAHQVGWMERGKVDIDAMFNKRRD